MNRFECRKSNAHPLLRSVLATALVFCCCVCLFLWGVSSISGSAREAQAESLEKALLRSAVHCYAMEGAYPESLDYLTEHYGIQWEEEKYVVDYEITASNLKPVITVIPQKGGTQ